MIFLAILIGYAAWMIIFGALVSRHVRASSDFFVAGHRLGAGLIFSTLLAANIGAGSTIGAAGLGYRDGLSAWWWVGSAALGSIVLAMWIGPLIRRAAVRGDPLLGAEYFANLRGFGRRCGVKHLVQPPIPLLDFCDRWLVDSRQRAKTVNETVRSG